MGWSSPPAALTHSATTPSTFEAIVLVFPTVFSYAPLAATILLVACLLWMVVFVLLVVDTAWTQRFAAATHQTVRNFLAFLYNIFPAFVFDSAAGIILWSAIFALSLPFAIARLELVRDPSRFRFDSAPSKLAFTNFIMFLRALEWAITLHATRHAMLRWGAPYQRTFITVALYWDFVHGRALPPNAGVVIGRMIGAHEVVQVEAVNNGRRARRHG